MRSTQAAALLLLFALTFVPAEASFTVLIQDVLDCVQIHCTEKIYACQRHYGAGLKEQVKGCVVESCKGAVKRCIDWTVDVFVAASGSENWLSTEALEHLTETVKEDIVDSFFNCFILNDHHPSSVCFLEDLLDKAEPHLHLLSKYIGIQDSDLALCWLKKALRQMLNCFSLIDQNYRILLESNTNMQTTFNRTEYMWCFDKVFQEKKCFQMYTRIFGSTPALLTLSKGIFVCIINELILASASC